MKNHSHLLNTFKLALVCGATLLPLSDANAGWNKLVEALQDVTPDALAPLKALRTLKLDANPNNMKWIKRSRQLAVLDSAPTKSVEGLKKHLLDRRLVDKTRNDKIAHKADDFAKAIQEVADSPERAKPGFVELARRAAEYKAGAVAVKQEKAEVPASTLIRHSYITVADTIRNMEEFNAEMGQLGDLDADIKRTISSNKAQLPQLRRLLELGVIEVRDGENLGELISQHEGNASSKQGTPAEEEAPNVLGADGNISVDLFIQRANWDIKHKTESAAGAVKVLKELTYAKSLGIVSFGVENPLHEQIIAKGGDIQTDESGEAPVVQSEGANSSPIHVPAAQSNDELANLEFALSLAENDRERRSIQAQIAKLKPQPVESVVNSNHPTPPAPQPVGHNIEEEIQLCMAVIHSDASEREKGIYKAKLAKLEAAKRTGLVTYENEIDLLAFVPATAPKTEAIVSAPSVVSSVQAAQLSVPAQIESIHAILPTLEEDERRNYNTLLQMHIDALEYGIETYTNNDDLEKQLREHGYRGNIVHPNDNAGGQNNGN